jgi:hypothetical protein
MGPAHEFFSGGNHQLPSEIVSKKNTIALTKRRAPVKKKQNVVLKFKHKKSNNQTYSCILFSVNQQ